MIQLIDVIKSVFLYLMIQYRLEKLIIQPMVLAYLPDVSMLITLCTIMPMVGWVKCCPVHFIMMLPITYDQIHFYLVAENFWVGLLPQMVKYYLKIRRQFIILRT